MNFKFAFLILPLVFPATSFAEYRMNVKFSDPSSISFGTVSNPGEETPEEPVDPVDACPTNFATPVYQAGYPKVRNNSLLYFDVMITSAGGYASMADFSSGQRYLKMVKTTVTGVSFGNGALYAGTEQTWSVNPGQVLNVILTPVAFDMQEGVECPITGTPVQLVNKSYAQLYSEAQ